MKRHFPLILPLSILSFLSMLCLSSCEQDTEFRHVHEYYVMQMTGTELPDSMGRCIVDLELDYPYVKDSTDTLINKLRAEVLLEATGDSSYMNKRPEVALRMLRETLVEDFASEMREAVRTARKFKSISAKVPPILFHNAEYVLRASAVYADADVISYRIEQSIDNGAATGPVENAVYLSFDAHTGNRIELDDLFIEGFEPAATAQIKEQIMFDNGFESEEQMLMEGYTRIGEMTPSANFLLKPDSIVFYYAPYEIAVGAMGATEVTLPLSFLKTVLKESSPYVKAMKRSRD